MYMYIYIHSSKKLNLCIYIYMYVYMNDGHYLFTNASQCISGTPPRGKQAYGGRRCDRCGSVTEQVNSFL